MRDIYICDPQGNILQEMLQEIGYFGLPYRVWTATLKCIREQRRDEFQILPELWQEYWGEEGHAFLSPHEVDLLLKDIEHLQPFLKDIEAAETNIQEIQKFFYDLATICRKAKALKLSLKFEAD